MSLICHKNLTLLQRRSMQRLGVAVLLTAMTNFSSLHAANPIIDLFPVLSSLAAHEGHPSVFVVGTMSAVSLLPVLFAVWVVGSYLKAEPDEFVRTLVVRSLLWGIAVTMAGDAVAGVLMTAYQQPFPIGLLNADLLFALTGIAFRLIQRSYR